MEKQLRLQQEMKYDASIKINSLTRGYLCKKQNLLVLLRKEKEEKRQLELKRQQKLKEEAEAKGKYLSEGAAREWSTVVDIFPPPPSFKPVSLSLPRSPLSKTPKHVNF